MKNHKLIAIRKELLIPFKILSIKLNKSMASIVSDLVAQFIEENKEL